MADDDIDISDVDIDSPEYVDPDPDDVEVDDLRPDSVVVTEAQRQGRPRMVSRYAGQLNAIELAKRVKDDLTELSAPNERGLVIDAAITKLSLDILSENVKAKSVREAAQAIEVLHRVNTMSTAAGGGDRIDVNRRRELFAQVRQVLERTADSQGGELPPITREAIEVSYEERG